MISIIYHKNCLDGLMAAYLTTKYLALQYNGDFSDQAYKLFPMHYGDPIPEEVINDSDELYIVDFSFPPEVLVTISNIPKIVMLDHHESAAKKYGGYGHYIIQYDTTLEGANVLFEKEHSGCGLVLKYLIRDESLIDPLELGIAKAIEDRDLWKFTLPETKTICMVMDGLDKTVDAWDKFFKTTTDSQFYDLVEEADIKIKFSNNISESIAAKATMIKFQGYDIPVVNTSINISEVGNILAGKYNLSMSFFILTQSQEVVISMRSKSEEFDVSKLCSVYSGGGHLCAAGFKIPLSLLPDLLSSKL